MGLQVAGMENGSGEVLFYELPGEGLSDVTSEQGPEGSEAGNPVGTPGRWWAQQGAFQAEGTAIPSPGLCLEASPGTCIFPGQVCVCGGGGQVPSLVGEDPTCCVTWKKKRGFGQSALSAKWAQGWRVQVKSRLGRSARLLGRGQGPLWEP